jgi:hypothetical protein
MNVITVPKFFERIRAFWDVSPLRSHSVSGHWRICTRLGVNVAVTIFTIFGVGIFAINFFFSPSLPRCVVFPVRPRGFAFWSAGRSVFEKVQLSGQFTVLESLCFLALGVLMR